MSELKQANFSNGKIEVEEHYSNGVLIRKLINGIEVDISHKVNSIFIESTHVILKEEMTLKEARDLFDYPHRNDTK